MKYLFVFFSILLFCSPIYASQNVSKNKSDLPSDTSIVLTHYGIKDSWVSIDKLHHFYYSASLTGLSYLTAHYLLKCDNGDKNLTRLISGSSVLTLGLIKELYDRTHSSTGFSYKDLTFDFIGVISGLVLFSIYER
ncbi:MAG TPA: DUF2279 domain-containing protein [Firmicutes bacterium]|uniref:VanZ-like domain-containing protein n=1 Tax=candidate division TA06 bacterium TaxID=2250710 RepID=A0A660S705_UNCT6|nr:MAG: hypothetical protein DRP44_05505 [candidate division TA06 bacterium]HFD04796.1 DUF2279 domain-containing protein [Bacillota bacterium]